MSMRVWAVASLIAGAAVAALHADWIVTRQGERFEIQGTWQQKGKLVVFTLPNGTLSSIRADRVDFEASKRATEAAKKAAEAPPGKAPGEVKPKRKAVIVLTDKDFRKPQPPAEAAEGQAADARSATAGKDAAAAAKEAPIRVAMVTWDRVPAAQSRADGAEINGEVRNVSQDYLTQVSVTAVLFDDAGAELGKFPATVERQLLKPGETSKFHLVTSGIYAFASIKWETQGKGFKGGGHPASQAGTPADAASPAPAATPPPAPASPAPPPSPPL
jgi:hypothetical protein